MKKHYLLLMAVVVGLSSCELLNPFGEPGDPAEKQKVIGEWNYEHSETDGNIQYPTPAEEGNKLILRADDTFTCIEKGREINGDWDFLSHRKKNVISLMEDGSWECIDYRVESVDETKLVYSFRDTDEHCGTRTTVTMSAANPGPTAVD